MRAAVRADKEARAASSTAEARREAEGAPLSLLGLSLLAERGLSLLGLTAFNGHRLPPPSISAEPVPEPTWAQKGEEARRQAEDTLRAMHSVLEAQLGAPLLRLAMAIAEESPPGDDANGGGASAVEWDAWEAGRLAELRALLTHGRSTACTDNASLLSALKNTRMAAAAAPPPPSKRSEGETDQLARAVLALALWRTGPRAGRGPMPVRSAGAPANSTPVSTVRPNGLFSVRGPWDMW